MFCEKGVLEYFVKFTVKHMCKRLFFNKVAGLTSPTSLNSDVSKLWHRCFPMNFAKFLGATILQNISGSCFSILIQLHDFNCIKHRRGMETVSVFAFLKR